MFASGHFELYQSYQERNEFNYCEYLVSTLGIDNSQALFIGVYEVKSITPVTVFPDHYDVPFKGKAKVRSKYRYELEKLVGFEDLEHRLVIQWEGVAQGWCVKIDTFNNEVVQLMPKGYVRDFPGYLEIDLSFRELQGIVNDPNANAIWHKMLSSVGAVYLIVDTKEGKQYVGSASGKKGLLGRWKEYAINGHGNNKKLKELIDADAQRIYSLKYTILQPLPKHLTINEILKEEIKYKNKLGTRAYGLNLN
ncbi:GIY-YIG nuclease family protein [Peribacillus frigoritolerans]|uniref:GIY-YIG nuclease family protein n=1 Tax=Peribacillus frigoritolerans TaxID=450367 RepID=UPI003D2CCB33